MTANLSLESARQLRRVARHYIDDDHLGLIYERQRGDGSLTRQSLRYLDVDAARTRKALAELWGIIKADRLTQPS